EEVLTTPGFGSGTLVGTSCARCPRQESVLSISRGHLTVKRLLSRLPPNFWLLKRTNERSRHRPPRGATTASSLNRRLSSTAPILDQHLSKENPLQIHGI